MAYDFDSFDARQLEDGEWCEFRGGRFKIASIGNPRFRDAERRLRKEYRRKHGEDLTARQEDEIIAHAFAEGVLRDWAEITGKDENGNRVPVPYSAEAAADLLMRDPRLASFVGRKAGDIDRFDRSQRESEAKKPQPA